MADSLIDNLETTPPAEGTETPPPSVEGENNPPSTEGGDDPFSAYRNEENGLLFGRYKTVEDALGSFKEMDGELGRLKREKAPEIPEDINLYTFEFDGETEGEKVSLSPENDPLLAYMAPVFQEGKVGVDQAKLIVSKFLEFGKVDLKAEKEKLGTEADTIIASVTNYAAKRGTEDIKLLAKLAGRDSGMLKELHTLIAAVGGPKVPDTLEGGVRTGRDPKTILAEAQAFKDKHKDVFSTRTDLKDQYEKLMDEYAAAVNSSKKAS